MAKEQPQEQVVESDFKDEDGNLLTQTGEVYKTGGTVMLRARAGHRFLPSDKSLAPVTDEGTKYTRENADAILKEASFMGEGYIVEVKDEG